MITTHNLGFPRIGDKRQLKFALEQYWRDEIPAETLLKVGKNLRESHWRTQQNLDFVPVGDFSFYDHVLDMSFALGNVIGSGGANSLDSYFRAARGQSSCSDACGIEAKQMTKWFNTNYHYLVPEFSLNTQFNANPERWLEQIDEAKAQGYNPKPVLLGPMTYLWLGKAVDVIDPLSLLPKLLTEYIQILNSFADAGVQWVQIDEPILCLDLPARWKKSFEQAYYLLKNSKLQLLLCTYFGPLKDNLRLLCDLPVAGIHVDVCEAPEELKTLVDWLPSHKILSLGVINGRNIWRANLNGLLDRLEPVYAKLQNRLWLAPSCSLLHVPVSLSEEDKLEPEIKSCLAFATEKLDELSVLAQALSLGRDSVRNQLGANAEALRKRSSSTKVHNAKVNEALSQINTNTPHRQSPFNVREKLQAKEFNLPLFPTTTIGSFPQTDAVRKIRAQFKNGSIDLQTYEKALKKEIAHTIEQQLAIGLDVLVHGEAERNDMVEYFGEQLEGFAFTQFAWVQSYGSRCVKPPILFGDVSRPQPITVAWAEYAQSLTSKPVKGMLTGPVTILNWSFVRDDIPRSAVCNQLALALRDEVLDLERAGIKIIQIDEAALREGLPLRKQQWPEYLSWAVTAFKIAANGVEDKTQIHTHMCYSNFNDIIEHIANMDADVITIETSRSNMALLQAFESFNYPNQIGPGVYDIHSPNIPNGEQIEHLIEAAAKYVPVERLWVNPDCGLKTRAWDEVTPALKNMVEAAKVLRQRFNKSHKSKPLLLGGVN